MPVHLFSILFASFSIFNRFIIARINYIWLCPKSVSGGIKIALLAVFMPALMLSDWYVRNLPLVVQIIGRLLPATHFMVLIGFIYGGDDWKHMVLKSAVLGYIVVLICAVNFSL